MTKAVLIIWDDSKGLLKYWVIPWDRFTSKIENLFDRCHNHYVNGPISAKKNKELETLIEPMLYTAFDDCEIQPKLCSNFSFHITRIYTFGRHSL